MYIHPFFYFNGCLKCDRDNGSIHGIESQGVTLCYTCVVELFLMYTCGGELCLGVH